MVSFILTYCLFDDRYSHKSLGSTGCHCNAYINEVALTAFTPWLVCISWKENYLSIEYLFHIELCSGRYVPEVDHGFVAMKQASPSLHAVPTGISKNVSNKWTGIFSKHFQTCLGI